MRNLAFVVVMALCSVLMAQTQPAPAPAARVIEDVSYPSDAAATRSWQAMPGAGPATLAEVDGRKAIKLPIDFGKSRLERVYWDKAVSLDFTSARGIEFEMNCPQVGAVSTFSIYFQSGDGWYKGSFGPSSVKGWSTVTVAKSSMRIEGKPDGWGRIETIRISPRRGGDVDTPLYIRNMRVIEQDGPIAIISGASVAAIDPSELESVVTFSKNVADKLDELGLPYVIISDSELTVERLKGRKLVILPHNPRMPDKVAAMLADSLPVIQLELDLQRQRDLGFAFGQQGHQVYFRRALRWKVCLPGYGRALALHAHQGDAESCGFGERVMHVDGQAQAIVQTGGD